MDDSYADLLRSTCPDFGDGLFTIDEAEEIFLAALSSSRCDAHSGRFAAAASFAEASGVLREG